MQPVFKVGDLVRIKVDYTYKISTVAFYSLDSIYKIKRLTSHYRINTYLLEGLFHYFNEDEIELITTEDILLYAK